MPLIKVGELSIDDDGAQRWRAGPSHSVDIAATHILGRLGLYGIEFGVVCLCAPRRTQRQVSSWLTCAIDRILRQAGIIAYYKDLLGNLGDSRKSYRKLFLPHKGCIEI